MEDTIREYIELVLQRDATDLLSSKRLERARDEPRANQRYPECKREMRLTNRARASAALVGPTEASSYDRAIAMMPSCHFFDTDMNGDIN